MRFLSTILIAASCMWGCASGQYVEADPSEALESDRYRLLLQTWTRQQKVYRHFEAKIFVTATYLSPEFRDAYVRRKIQVLGLPTSHIRRMQSEHAERAQRYHEFVISVYTGERRWNDFDDDSSMWRITLGNDRNEEVSPIEVIKEDPRDGDLTAYFPYISVFQEAYMVRFPKTILELNSPVLPPDANHFELNFLSGVAVARLSWDVSPPKKGKKG